MKELLTPISDFEKIIKRYPDKSEYAFEFFSFFKYLQRVKTTSNVVPIIELGTILKHEKPVIFHELRNYAGRSPMIEIITNVDMDLIEAQQRIDSIKGKS